MPKNFNIINVHHWTETVNDKTQLTISATVRLDNGKIVSYEYTCPTPIEDWSENDTADDNVQKKYANNQKLPTNLPPDHYKTKLPDCAPVEEKEITLKVG